ncbi:serine hydrolase [[Bacillus] enclensis]|uniref:CubicO group peptidase, beta-lactamase class C family n=1 Tax=[Bacillus] enclensis TaxID=1402860 RepID=A0A0V8HAL7_9BACI|nr:serine hydrolase domain-containing protein [[Bacillus] enclensis]KSU59473.1 serine hydrolase [[Bacillus] enclensis]SCC31005.1 CubicO group peptidase, beta-lactamase class C family [[Bacillus] enclensis]
MKKKPVSIALTALMCTSLFSPAVFAEGGDKDRPVSKAEQVRAHPAFTWGNPAPSSPVLHPGSARGAGMIQSTLDRIDPMMEEKIEEGVMPGAVALVARSGQIVKHEAYGDAYRYTDGDFTEADSPIAMQKDTIFDLASISKIFTTTAAMILYEDGAFGLDDPVAEYIPEFAANGKEDVTIRQLMTHTSGFTAWIPLYSKGNDREDRLQLVFNQPLANEPGTAYTYSDLNMITLGAIIERLSGQRLDEFVKENITEPIGMKDTMYNPPASLKERIAATEYQPAIGRGLVWGEVHDENAWSLDGVAGHAGVFSTAEDLAKFAHMFVKDGRYGNKQILKPETVKLLSENQIPEFPGDDHGLGWELNQGWFMDGLAGENSLGHTGYTGTSIVVDKDNDTIAILLTNRVHPSRTTVSTNTVRRPFAQLVADSIPVDMEGKKKEQAWFAGYGDKMERSLAAEVNVDKEAVLSFDTWYRIEKDSDFGHVETSMDGETWTAAATSFTGNSEGWTEEEVKIPAGTRFIRFSYETDASVNYRGWYVKDIELKADNGHELKTHFQGWTKRSY